MDESKWKKISAVELAAVAAAFVTDGYSPQESLERALILIEAAKSFLKEESPPDN